MTGKDVAKYHFFSIASEKHKPLGWLRVPKLYGSDVWRSAARFPTLRDAMLERKIAKRW